MLRINFKRTLIVATLAIVAVTGAARAQSVKDPSAHLPFAFDVGSQTLPPGTYSFEFVTTQTDVRVLLIRDARGRNHCMAFTRGVKTPVQEQTKLVFHRYGETYLLKQLWLAGSDTGRELQTPAAFRRESRQAQVAQSRKLPDVITLNIDPSR